VQKCSNIGNFQALINTSQLTRALNQNPTGRRVVPTIKPKRAQQGRRNHEVRYHVQIPKPITTPFWKQYRKQRTTPSASF